MIQAAPDASGFEIQSHDAGRFPAYDGTRAQCAAVTPMSQPERCVPESWHGPIIRRGWRLRARRMSLPHTLSRTVAVLVPGTGRRPSYDTTVRVQGTSQRLGGSLWRHRLGSRGRPGVTRRPACTFRALVFYLFTRAGSGRAARWPFRGTPPGRPSRCISRICRLRAYTRR